MRVYGKRLFLLAAVTLIAVGIRIGDGGLKKLKCEGTYTFVSAKNEVVYQGEIPPLCFRGGHSRIDTEGDEQAALRLLKEAGADIKRVERFDGITVFYAYLSGIEKCETLSFGTVNIMIAVNNGKMVVGSPLIVGSF